MTCQCRKCGAWIEHMVNHQCLPKIESIKEIWESYLENVIPEGAGPVQISETKAAFYGACAALLGIMIDITDLKEDDAFSALEKIKDELLEYNEEMKQTIDARPKKCTVI